MFLWMLSVSVLSAGALGVVDGAWLDETLRELGLRPTAVEAVAQFLQGSDDAQWWLILVGGWLVLWTGYLGAKALVLVHAAVWGVLAPQAQKQRVMSLVFSGTAVALILSMSVADTIQAKGGGVEFVAFLVSTSIPFALWLAVSSRLPPRPGSSRQAGQRDAALRASRDRRDCPVRVVHPRPLDHRGGDPERIGRRAALSRGTSSGRPHPPLTAPGLA